MNEKIKNFFGFIKSGWSSGYRGKIGIGLIILSLFFFVRLFCGPQTLQGFIIKSWELKQNKQELEIKKQELQTLQNHHDLLLNASPDYVEELGLQKLNLGDPEFKELKY